MLIEYKSKHVGCCRSVLQSEEYIKKINKFNLVIIANDKTGKGMLFVFFLKPEGLPNLFIGTKIHRCEVKTKNNFHPLFAGKLASLKQSYS
jgi:hypothetical protein